MLLAHSELCRQRHCLAWNAGVTWSSCEYHAAITLVGVNHHLGEVAGS